MKSNPERIYELLNENIEKSDGNPRNLNKLKTIEEIEVSLRTTYGRYFETGEYFK
jgi:hypothetical protein